MLSYMRHSGASAGRGGYRRALAAGELLGEVRGLLSSLFNLPEPDRVIFTSNVTESLNLALRGCLRPGDRVVTSSMEHHAVWRTLMDLKRTRRIEVSVLRCTSQGLLDKSEVLRGLDPRPDLMVLLHASNVSGGLLPIPWISGICRKKGIPLLVDAAQTAGVVPIDVEKWGIDMLAFTGHKGMLGPMGTGGLYIREGLNLKPLKTGGTGTRSLEEFQPRSFPDGYEAGTLNIPAILGLGAAVEYLLERGVSSIWRHKRLLIKSLLEELTPIPGITIYGPGDPRVMVGLVSFNLRGWNPAEAARILEGRYGVMLRSGYHCAPCAHRTLGSLDRGSIRASVGAFTQQEDLEALVAGVRYLARHRGGRGAGSSSCGDE